MSLDGHIGYLWGEHWLLSVKFLKNGSVLKAAQLKFDLRGKIPERA